jgi:CPA2 family monovalent cation:H+ antiporter-2
VALAAAAPGTDIAVVLLEIGGLLLLLGLLSKLAKQLRTSPVAFYLAVGVLLGVSPVDVQPQVVDVGAAIGVVLLLFFIGLEYTGKELLGTLRHQARSGNKCFQITHKART